MVGLSTTVAHTRGGNVVLLERRYRLAAESSMLDIRDSISPVVAQRMYSPENETGRPIASTVVTTLVFPASIAWS